MLLAIRHSLVILQLIAYPVGWWIAAFGLLNDSVIWIPLLLGAAVFWASLSEWMCRRLWLHVIIIVVATGILSFAPYSGWWRFSGAALLTTPYEASLLAVLLPSDRTSATARARARQVPMTHAVTQLTGLAVAVILISISAPYRDVFKLLMGGAVVVLFGQPNTVDLTADDVRLVSIVHPKTASSLLATGEASIYRSNLHVGLLMAYELLVSVMAHAYYIQMGLLVMRPEMPLWLPSATLVSQIAISTICMKLWDLKLNREYFGYLAMFETVVCGGLAFFLAWILIALANQENTVGVFSLAVASLIVITNLRIRPSTVWSELRFKQESSMLPPLQFSAASQHIACAIALLCANFGTKPVAFLLAVSATLSVLMSIWLFLQQRRFTDFYKAVRSDEPDSANEHRVALPVEPITKTHTLDFEEDDGNGSVHVVDQTDGNGL